MHTPVASAEGDDQLGPTVTIATREESEREDRPKVRRQRILEREEDADPLGPTER